MALLPYLGQEELYKRFRRDEPWDSPHNKELLEKMPECYSVPAGANQAPSTTFYQVFVGKGTAFEGTRGVRAEDILDGTMNTLCIVEGARPGRRQ